jgi:hypothetical protein
MLNELKYQLDELLQARTVEMSFLFNSVAHKSTKHDGNIRSKTPLNHVAMDLQQEMDFMMAGDENSFELVKTNKKLAGKKGRPLQPLLEVAQPDKCLANQI